MDGKTTDNRQAFHLLSLLSVVTAFIMICSVSDARRCDTSYSGISSSEDDDKYCCKTKVYINREELDEFYCEGGCCGDINDEYCCHYINEKALPYVIGFSILGVVIVVVVAIIMFCVLRRACRGYREYKQHRHVLTEVYAARTLQELRESNQPPPMGQGAVRIVHPTVVVGEPEETDGRDNTHSLFTVPGPGNDQPRHSHRHADTSPSAGPGRDFDYDREVDVGAGGRSYHQDEHTWDKYAEPPPSYESVIQ